MKTSPNEYLHKICVVGDVGSGKTSFIKRLSHDTFNNDYKATIGVDFGLKVVTCPNDVDPTMKDTYRLQLWDIAGQERYGNMTKVYYKESSAYFIVCDITRSSTMDAIKKWVSDIQSKHIVFDKHDELIPPTIFLLINKIDLVDDDTFTRFVSVDYTQIYGVDKWFFMSSKNNVGVHEAFMAMVEFCKTVQCIEQKDPVVTTNELKTCDKVDQPSVKSTLYKDIVTEFMDIIQHRENEDVILQCKLLFISFISDHSDQYKELKELNFIKGLQQLLSQIKLHEYERVDDILNYFITYDY
jgi:small GTP-binding protein